MRRAARLGRALPFAARPHCDGSHARVAVFETHCRPARRSSRELPRFECKERVMRMRTLMVGMMAAGLVGGMADAARADRMELKLSAPPGQPSVAEITVDGPNKNGSYNAVYTETLAYYVMVRGDVPDKTKGDGMGFVRLEGG